MDTKFGTKQRNLVKFDRARNVWYLHLGYLFLPSIAKPWFLEEKLVTRLGLHPNLRFLLIFRNFRRSSLKSFNNSWANSYTKFVILYIKVRFTYGKLDLYRYIVKFQNTLAKIAWKFFFCLCTFNHDSDFWKKRSFG